MEQPPVNHDAYVHVRMIIGVVVGLGVGRLLTGLARFIQHPSREIIYPVHIAWAGFIFLLIVHFWWFEFRLEVVSQWQFQRYLFVIFYACLLFLATTLAFPDKIDDYTGYWDYLMSRRAWFFGLLAVIFLVDLADTALKGADYFRSLGLEYPLRNVGYALAFVVAAVSSNPRFHAGLVAIALIYQAFWVFRLYDVI